MAEIIITILFLLCIYLGVGAIIIQPLNDQEISDFFIYEIPILYFVFWPIIWIMVLIITIAKEIGREFNSIATLINKKEK